MIKCLLLCGAPAERFNHSASRVGEAESERRRRTLLSVGQRSKYELLLKPLKDYQRFGKTPSQSISHRRLGSPL